MTTYVTFGRLGQEVAGTANPVEKISNLFFISNSSSNLAELAFDEYLHGITIFLNSKLALHLGLTIVYTFC